VSRDPLLYLDDIVDACRKIGQYLEGIGREEFDADSMRFDAVVRNLEVIGEAARQLPGEVREALPNHPWTNIVGMRNIIAHGYFGVDPDIVWSVATTHIAALQSDVTAFLAEDQDNV